MKGGDTISILTQQKINYINRAEVGTLVAFNTSDKQVDSAKIINRSIKNRKLKVVTITGQELIISYDDVLWVKTNSRFPKGVYELLKARRNTASGKDEN